MRRKGEDWILTTVTLCKATGTQRFSAKSSTPECFVLLAHLLRGEQLFFHSVLWKLVFQVIWARLTLWLRPQPCWGPLAFHEAGSALPWARSLPQLQPPVNAFLMASQAHQECSAEIAFIFLLIFNAKFSSWRRKTFWFRGKSEIIFILRLWITPSQISVSIWTIVWQVR